eukprot:TRINITY_DN28705_c0_g1_i1.p1 TRINITY_DN28705_c0_g1~~TRINITY_DN28705_c0_g1_i1.p1  ORF type:complete len:547 (-),score=70.68 TRINITY_DN28705_c0_g1_i1:169-1809(-)
MEPVLILAVFFIVLILRRRLYRREAQQRIHAFRLCGKSIAALLQPHTCFFVVLIGIYTFLVNVFFRLFQEYPWLEPKTFSIPTLNQTQPGVLQPEFMLPFWLRTLCFIAPIFIGLTFVVTAAHIWLHFPKIRGFDDDLRWYPSYSHDLAMQVVALPLVYGIFALDSVYRMLRLITGEAYMDFDPSEFVTPARWSSHVYHIEQMYDTNFELADLYEAWALQSFALLCFVRVGRQIKLEAPTVKYIIETLQKHLAGVQGDGSRDRRILDDLIILNNPQAFLFEPLQRTAGIGVMVFVYTYATKSLYLLGLSIMEDAPINKPLCGPEGLLPAVCSLTSYVDGAAFLASTLAIYNLVVFEHKLDVILRKENFRPFLKFLTVKVLVSIAFFQNYILSVVMQTFLQSPDVQIKLCYACLICFEVLPIGLVVYYAWRPLAGDWYSGDCAHGMTIGQLAREDALECDSASFVASRRPTAIVDEAMPLGNEVSATLELRGRVTAQEGMALESLINALSTTMTAVYKPAALFRSRSLAQLGCGAASSRLAGLAAGH